MPVFEPLKPTLVFDSRCSPCGRFKSAISFLDARRKMRYVSLEGAEMEGLLYSLPAGQRRRSFHLLSPDGRTRSGPAAFPELARLLPGGRLSAALLERSVPASRAAQWIYLVFSRLHGSGACSYRRPGSASMSISMSMRDAKGRSESVRADA